MLTCRMNVLTVSFYFQTSRQRKLAAVSLSSWKCPQTMAWPALVWAPNRCRKENIRRPSGAWHKVSSHVDRRNLFVHQLFTIAFIVNGTALVYYHARRCQCWVTDSQASVYSGLKQTGSSTGWCSLAQAQLKLHRYSDSALSCSQGKARPGL